MKLKATHTIIMLWVVLSFVVLLTPQPVEASGNFSGSDKSNYTCPKLDDYPTPTPSVSDSFTCNYGIKAGTSSAFITNAVIKPPTLKVLQYWFMRILYGAWAASGIVFSLIMTYLGFKWMTSQGDSAKIGDVKKRAKNWFIGLALIFLSYPILTTLFNIIGVSQNECYEQIQMPGFQFFFPQACNAGTSNTSTTP